MSGFTFTDEQIERYSRHILLSEVGVEGQEKLLNSSALVVGAGGLGSPALLYLASAGVGRLGVVDGDVVELSNLQRQILHTTSDLGRSKTLSAKEAIKAVNPDCVVETFAKRLNASNIRDVVRNYEIILDGSDNFPTRFLVADCCWMEQIPLVTSAVVRFDGQLLSIVPPMHSPCYRCLYCEPPLPGTMPTCQEAGVLGAVVGVMGTLQAVETLKLLLGIGDVLHDRLLIYDALEGRFQVVRRRKDPECPLCGENPSITELMEYDESCVLRQPGGG